MMRAHEGPERVDVKRNFRSKRGEGGEAILEEERGKHVSEEGFFHPPARVHLARKKRGKVTTKDVSRGSGP